MGVENKANTTNHLEMSFGPPLPSSPFGIPVRESQAPRHTIELFLDFCCPFSCKTFNTVNKHVVDKHKTSLFLVRLVVQPWHPQGTYMHEAVIAMGMVKPEHQIAYIQKVFDHQQQFFDDKTINKTRAQI